MKNQPAIQRHRKCGLDTWSVKFPGEGHKEPIPVFLSLQNSMDRGNLAGYSPKGHGKLDTTGVTKHTNTHTSTTHTEFPKLLISFSYHISLLHQTNIRVCERHVSFTLSVCKIHTQGSCSSTFLSAQVLAHSKLMQ